MPKKNNNIKIKKFKKNKKKVLCILIDSYSYMKKKDKVFYAFVYAVSFKK